MSDQGGVPTIPDVVETPSRADYLDVMTRAVFQAGVSWHQIARNWEAHVSAFEGFDPERVAAYGDVNVERILETPGIMRTRRKVLATIANARALLELEREFGSVSGYARSFERYADLAKDFKKRFAFMGDMNVWYFFFRVRERVPQFESWIGTIPGDHPRMREMVDRARSMGRSSEVAGF